MMPSSNHSADERELVGRTHHAFGFDSAHLARFDVQTAATSHRSSRRERFDPRRRSSLRSRSSAVVRSPTSIVPTCKTVGIRMLLERDDSSGDDARDRGPLLDCPRRENRAGRDGPQSLAIRRANRRIRAATDRARAFVFGDGSFFRPAAARKSGSLSIKRRMSSTSYRVKAKRSTPKPNAQPEYTADRTHFAQHVGMHHTRAAEFDPARAAAHAARSPAPVAFRARRIDFGARLGKRKERRAKAHALIGPKSSRHIPVSMPLR